MLKIVTNPNPILRKKSLPVTNFSDAKIQKLIPEMIEAMYKNDGVGLAAPQIGENIRLIIVDNVDHRGQAFVAINPQIVKKSLLKEWGEEGCLSIPGKIGEVKRNKKITVKYIDQSGKEVNLAAQGLLARIFQHEIDHLNGILFIDKTRKIADIKVTNVKE